MSYVTLSIRLIKSVLVISCPRADSSEEKRASQATANERSVIRNTRAKYSLGESARLEGWERGIFAAGVRAD